MYICKEYPNGVGHIEAVAGFFLVSFYGRRVTQFAASTLQEARYRLRHFAMPPALTSTATMAQAEDALIAMLPDVSPDGIRYEVKALVNDVTWPLSVTDIIGAVKERLHIL